MKLLHWVVLAGTAGFVYAFLDGKDQNPQDVLHTKEAQVLTTYYASGGVRTEITYQDGRKEGPSRQFRPDGSLEAEGHFHHSRMEGPWTFFRTDGTLDLERSGTYVGGELAAPESVATQSLDALPSASPRE